VDNLVLQLFELPKIRYESTNIIVTFEGIDFCVRNNPKECNAISIQTMNPSSQSFIFNNSQQNIKLLDAKNNASNYASNYAIERPEIVSTGENKTVDLRFPATNSLQGARLKFQSEKEWIFIEL